MDYERMIETKDIEYSNFEKDFLSYVVPSVVGKNKSDLENICFFRDKVAKFDFSVVDPFHGLTAFLKSVEDDFKDFPELLNFKDYDLGDAFDVRKNISFKLNEFVEKKAPLVNFIRYRSNEFESSQNLILDKNDFNQAYSKIKNIFPSDSSIFLYGSSLNKKDPNDFDFRVVLPEISKKDYLKYIEVARNLSKEKITFGLNFDWDFKNFQISDQENIFVDKNKSILLQGNVSIYDSPLNEKVRLCFLGNVLIKTRKMLKKDSFWGIPKVVRARRNEPYYMNRLLVDLFGDKGFEFQEFSEEKLSLESIKQALIEANRNLSELIIGYGNELMEKLK